jgi:hypothetical protein
MRTLIGRMRGTSYIPPATNRITNFRASGATVGNLPTPGTLPTNWEVGGPAGLTIAIESIQSFLGANEVRFRISGTTTTAGIATIRFDARNAPAFVASSGQTRVARMRAAGPVGWNIVYRAWDNALTQVDALVSVALPASINSIVGAAFTPTAPTTAFITSEVRKNYNLNEVVNDVVIMHIPTLSDN